MMTCVRTFVIYDFMFIDSITLPDKRSGVTGPDAPLKIARVQITRNVHIYV